MKLRATFLVFVSLLLISSLANAAQTSTPTDAASANLAAIFSAPASPDGAQAQLPSFDPPPTDRAGFNTCGTCSETVCVGQTVGTICRVQSGAVFTCQHAYVICTAKDCECWTGPLP
ncbi:MAG TPA: hypothetical protein VGS07_18055 [Thermoanaerobaculia bacterium]|jgi:hypothetical protein|nr:hypothetical protein [Thermoanaerobaculia bacterium]